MTNKVKELKFKTKPTDSCPICSSQEEKVTSMILSFLQKRKYKKHTVILEQDSELDGFFLIHKGKVKVSKISAAGKEVVIEILTAGQTFGEAAVLGKSLRSDCLTASDETEVYFIAKNDFQQILQKNTELYKPVVESLVRWMDKLHLIIENISLSSAKERVWSHLCRLQQEQNLPLIHLSQKKHEVAMMLGLRPETFSRTLSELADEGVIKMNHRQIQILKYDYTVSN